MGTNGVNDILLETERLVLRRFRPVDVAVFSAYRSDPVIARYQAWTAPVSLKAAAAKIREYVGQDPSRAGWFQYAIELKADATLIGDVGVNRSDDLLQAMLGFTVKADRQGRGYATEAVRAVLADLFEHRGLTRVAAECDSRNHRSARLLQRTGFRFDGLTAGWAQDGWTEAHLYSLTADRWLR